MTTKDQIETLLRLAGEAREGKWTASACNIDEAEEHVGWAAVLRTHEHNGDYDQEETARDAATVDAVFVQAASPDVVKALCEEVVRLRATVEAAVSAGLSLEEAYETSHRQLHDYEEWGAEQWGRIQAARTALCAFSDALKGGDHG